MSRRRARWRGAAPGLGLGSELALFLPLPIPLPPTLTLALSLPLIRRGAEREDLHDGRCVFVWPLKRKPRASWPKGEPILTPSSQSTCYLDLGADGEWYLRKDSCCGGRRWLRTRKQCRPATPGSSLYECTPRTTSKTSLISPARATQAAGWPRATGAWGSLGHDLALTESRRESELTQA